MQYSKVKSIMDEDDCGFIVQFLSTEPTLLGAAVCECKPLVASSVLMFEYVIHNKKY